MRLVFYNSVRWHQHLGGVSPDEFEATTNEQLASFVSAVDHDAATSILSVDFGSVATLTIVGIQADQISWDIVSVLS